MKGTIYIAGPMTGHEDFNRPAFFEAQTAFEELEWYVVNPARNFGGRTDLPYQRYIDKALEQVAECDAIALIPGWPTSPGVLKELALALSRRLLIFSTQDCKPYPRKSLRDGLGLVMRPYKQEGNAQ